MNTLFLKRISVVCISFILLFHSWLEGRQKNFNGRIIYAFTSVMPGGYTKEFQLAYVFTDSTVTTFPVSEPGNFEMAVLKENKTLYHSRAFQDSVMVIRHDTDDGFLLKQELVTSDTCHIADHTCYKAIGEYTIGNAFAQVNTVFELQLSGLVFKAPPSFLPYDLVFNNRAGRIPLYIKKITQPSLAGGQESEATTIEMKAISIEPR